MYEGFLKSTKKFVDKNFTAPKMFKFDEFHVFQLRDDKKNCFVLMMALIIFTYVSIAAADGRNKKINIEK